MVGKEIDDQIQLSLLLEHGDLVPYETLDLSYYKTDFMSSENKCEAKDFTYRT